MFYSFLLIKVSFFLSLPSVHRHDHQQRPSLPNECSRLEVTIPLRVVGCNRSLERTFLYDFCNHIKSKNYQGKQHWQPFTSWRSTKIVLPGLVPAAFIATTRIRKRPAIAIWFPETYVHFLEYLDLSLSYNISVLLCNIPFNPWRTAGGISGQSDKCLTSNLVRQRQVPLEMGKTWTLQMAIIQCLI